MPRGPDPAEREAHERTHIPFAAWCPSCVRGRAREDPHRRVDPGRAGHPTVFVAYGFLRNDEDEGCLTALAVTEDAFGGVYGVPCVAKV